MVVNLNAKMRDLERLMRAVRLCFQRMRAAGDALHADLGVSAALRAVLEALSDDDRRTVADIARAKSVSRQHIQKTVDALSAAGCVVTRPNPEHKRSPLIVLSPRGRKLFDVMREREEAILRELAAELPAQDLATALKLLTTLNDRLTPHAKGAPHDDD